MLCHQSNHCATHSIYIINLINISIFSMRFSWNSLIIHYATSPVKSLCDTFHLYYKFDYYFYFQYEIFLEFTDNSLCYVTSRIIVRHIPQNKERVIWHLQYTDWPDHGCPEDVYGFLGMLLSHPTVQEVVPQSDLSSTIIVSRCYNDLNFFLRLTACSTKRPYLTVIIG